MSFLNNPTVQKTLQNLNRRQGGSTTDFIKSLLFNTAGSYLQNLTSRLPQMKQNQLNELALERDMALKKVEGDYGSFKTERDFYNNYQQKGAEFLEQEIAKNWKNSITYNELRKQGIDDVEMFASTDYAKYLDDSRQEYLNRVNEYSKNEYITTKNPFSLAEPTYEKYKKEITSVNADPKYRDALGFLIGSIKDKHGPVVASELAIQGKITTPEVQDKIKGAQQVSEVVLNPENVRNVHNHFNAQTRDYEITTIRDDKVAGEESNKAFKLLVDEDLYTNKTRVTLNIEDDDNPLTSVQTKEVKLFGDFTQRRAKIKTWDGSKYVLNENLSGDNNSIIRAVSDMHGQLSGYLNDDYDRLNIPGGTESRLIGHINALVKSGNIKHDGETVVIEIPRTDLISKKLKDVNISSPTNADIVNTLFSDNVTSTNALSVTDSYANYRKDTNNIYARLKLEAFKNKGTIKIGDDEFSHADIVSLQRQFINTRENPENLNKDFLMYLMNPPESYLGNTVVFNDSKLTLGNVPKKVLETMIAGHEERFTDGSPVAELRVMLDAMPDETVLPPVISNRNTTELDELQRSLQKERQQLTQAERNRTGTLAGRLGLDYVDYYENRVKRIQDKLKTSEDKFVDVNFDFITNLEGFETNMYVPSQNGKVFEQSGPTIAVGADLGTKGKNYFKGLPPEIIKKIEPYFGLKGEEALTFVENNPLELSEEETLEVAKFVKNKELNLIRKQFSKQTGKSFSKLRPEIQTVVASTAFQYGSSGIPNFYNLAAKTIDNLNTENVTNLQKELLNFTTKKDEETGAMLYLNRRTSEAEYLSNLINSLQGPVSLLAKQ